MIQQHEDELALIISHRPLVHRYVLIDVFIIGEYLSLEGRASFEEVAIPHEMMVTVHINDQVADLVLPVSADVLGDEDVAHEIVDVELLEAGDPALYNLIVNQLMGL